MTGAGERHRMAGQDVAQKLAECTSQRCARCSLLKELRVSMKSAVVPWEFWSAASGGIVLPSR